MYPSTCHLPSTSCTSRWEGEGREEHCLSRGRAQAHTGTAVRLQGLGTSWGAQNPLQRSRHLAVSPTLSHLGLGPLPMAPPDPSPYLISRLCPCPLAVPHAPFPTLPPISQNNKLEKIPPGAFSELSNLRELYLQNNHLTDEGLDNETFW